MYSGRNKSSLVDDSCTCCWSVSIPGSAVCVTLNTSESGLLVVAVNFRSVSTAKDDGHCPCFQRMQKVLGVRAGSVLA